MRLRVIKPFVTFCRGFSKQAPVLSEESSTSSTSYLFVGGSKLPFSVEPDLDFRHRLGDLTALRQLLESRGYDIDRSFGDLRSILEKYDKWYKMASEFCHTYTKERLKEFVTKVDTDEYKTYASASLKLGCLERDVIHTCLQFPADLHPWTPIGNKEHRLATFVGGRRIEDGLSDSPIDQGASHMEILHTMDPKRPSIEFKADPPQCFLLGPAASLLRALDNYFTRSLSEQQYRRLSPAHFARSAMEEAYFGISDSKESPFRFLPIESIHGEKGIDTTWALNLAGHGPLPYLALFTRKTLGSNNSFPLKFFSHGMAYSGKSIVSDGMNSESWTLLNFPTQRPRVTLWVVYEKEDDRAIAEEVKTTIQDLLSKVHLSFGVSQQPSNHLIMSEMSRMDFTALSSNDSSPSVRLGSVSSHGDFLSRRIRLMMAPGQGHRKSGKKSEKLEKEYPKCCYAEIDLFSVMARVLEELFPVKRSETDSSSWWPSVLRNTNKG